jgi:hypothetical protein
MRRLFYLLMVIPLFLTGGFLIVETIFLAVISLIAGYQSHLTDGFRFLLMAIVVGTLGTTFIFSGRYAERSIKAATGCLFLVALLLATGLYLAYDLSHNPQPPSMRGEEGWVFFFGALPAIFLGVIGLIGSAGHFLLSGRASTIAQT